MAWGRGKVVWHVTMSLDGFIAGPGDGGIGNAVATALAAAKGRNLVLFGASIPAQCLAAGLVDDIIIHLAPVLLGDGIRLYGDPGVGQVNLERTYVGQSGQVTDLRFRVVK